MLTSLCLSGDVPALDAALARLALPPTLRTLVLSFPAEHSTSTTEDALTRIDSHLAGLNLPALTRLMLVLLPHSGPTAQPTAIHTIVAAHEAAFARMRARGVLAVRPSPNLESCERI